MAQKVFLEDLRFQVEKYYFSYNILSKSAYLLPDLRVFCFCFIKKVNKCRHVLYINHILAKMLAHSLSGFIAEGVSAFAYLPSDIVVQRLQVNSDKNFFSRKFRLDRSSSILKHIWKTEGCKGFFRGYYACLAVYGPNSAIWWASYEFSKNILNRIHENRVQRRVADSLNYLISGTFAGVVTSILTNPLEVAKTRLQLLERNHSGDSIKLRQGFAGMLKDIIKREGLSGLTKGLRPRIMLRVPGSAISLWGYEVIKDMSEIR